MIVDAPSLYRRTIIMNSDSMPRSKSVKKYWDSEKSEGHRKKLREGMKRFWARVKK